MKIASLIALLHPLIILVATAVSSYVLVNDANANWAVKPSAWLNNPGYHGFSEMLYQYTSCAANNGSGFEGLGDNNIFWNVSAGLVNDTGPFSADYWSGGYSRYTCQQKIHTRVCRYTKKRQLNIRANDFGRDYNYLSAGILSFIGLRTYC